MMAKAAALAFAVDVGGISAGAKYLGTYVYGRSGRPWTVAAAA
jgi:hypothetical protein